jgi:single-strand DNA-binding protein
VLSTDLLIRLDPTKPREWEKVMNLVVIEGVLARPAQHVELPSGTRLVTLEVTVRRTDGPAEPVPVTWSDPPTWVSMLDSGSEVVVLGRVRRRFFRASGITQSRTEVVASRVVRASARAKVSALVSEAVDTLEQLSQ